MTRIDRDQLTSTLSQGGGRIRVADLPPPVISQLESHGVSRETLNDIAGQDGWIEGAELNRLYDALAVRSDGNGGRVDNRVSPDLFRELEARVVRNGSAPARDASEPVGSARPRSVGIGAPQAPVVAAPQPAAPPPLRDRLAAVLPEGRFDHSWQRTRILDRAADFERRVGQITTDGTTIPALRTAMGRNFAPDAAIEFHGVASHFGPETLQAHARDRRGNLHVFTQDSNGRWVERRDLAAKVRAGQIPSSDPGRSRGPGGTATFAIARPQANGTYSIDVPDVSRFDHGPRVRPFQVGDTVQLTRQTGNAEVRTEGRRHVPQEAVEFGRITGHDGRGRWTVEMTNADGSAVTGRNGRPVVRHLTDAQLRRMNNPNVLRNGDTIHGDMRFDSTDANQRRMVDDFHNSPEYRAAAATNPGPNATADQRAAWERRMIVAGEAFLDRTIRYPEASDADRTTWRNRIAAIDARLAVIPPAGREATRLNTERAGLQAQLDSAEVDNREVTRLDGEITRLQGEIATERAAGRPTATLEGELRQARTDRAAAQNRVDQDRRYHSTLQNGSNPPPSIGDYYANGTGSCRHQAAAMQVLMQDLGIDARMTRGAANTGTGDYRGEHLWLEATLSNGQQLMVDPTWSTVDDLRGIYEGGPTRREVPRETEDRNPTGYRDSVVLDERRDRDRTSVAA